MQRDACEKGMKGEGIGRADGGKGREELRDGRVPRPTPYDALRFSSAYVWRKAARKRKVGKWKGNRTRQRPTDSPNPLNAAW